MPARPPLRQLEILDLISNGLTYLEAAKKMGIKRNTVRSQLYSLYLRLGANNMAHAYKLCVLHNYLPFPTIHDVESPS